MRKNTSDEWTKTVFKELDRAVDAIKKAEATNDQHDDQNAEKWVHRLEIIADFLRFAFGVCSDVALVVTAFPLPPISYKLYLGAVVTIVVSIKISRGR